MLLTRKSESAPAATPRLKRLSGASAPTIDRRTFLKRSGFVAGAGAFATQLPYGAIQPARAQKAAEGTGATEVHRTVCSHCSVGCALDAHVQNGVWVRQEPVFDSPINLGAHCAKGASIPSAGGMKKYQASRPLTNAATAPMRAPNRTALTKITGKNVK